jgi:hypothetical protein
MISATLVFKNSTLFFVCKRCGELWEVHGVTFALYRLDGADMSREEALRFLNGEGCPACWGR